LKRLLILFCVAGMLAAIPLSHVATAAKPETKVAICHVNSANDILDLGSIVIVFGKVIEVSENAVETHVTQHGDSTDFFIFDKEDREYWEEYYGISLPNANCGFQVYVDQGAE
jgi:hypothetical protein